MAFIILQYILICNHTQLRPPWGLIPRWKYWSRSSESSDGVKPSPALQSRSHHWALSVMAHTSNGKPLAMRRTDVFSLRFLSSIFSLKMRCTFSSLNVWISQIFVNNFLFFILKNFSNFYLELFLRILRFAEAFWNHEIQASRNDFYHLYFKK